MSADSGELAPSDHSDHWNHWTWIALATLILLWAVLFWCTWGRWGNVTIDSGREVYVPAVLAEQGKTLYKDIWYLYGPAGPYFNALLYQAFGTRLETTYWAGSLAALGSAVFLLLAGKQAGVMASGWAAGMILLAQAFVPSLFCFPFPYSFASVYGCLVSCAFLWVLLRAFDESGIRWTAMAGLMAGIAYLLKLEYGMAAYVGLAALLVSRGLAQRSWRFVGLGLAASLPGLVLAAGVSVWAVNLKGLDFLLHENLMSWPTSYFMRTYGRAWMSRTMSGGFNEPMIFIAILFVLYVTFWFSVGLMRMARSRGSRPVAMTLGIICALYGTAPWYWFGVPKFMPVLVCIGAGYLAYRTLVGSHMALRLLPPVLFALALCTRLLNGVMVWDYAIFYSGPVMVTFIAMLGWVVNRFDGSLTAGFAKSQAAVGSLAITSAALTLLPVYLGGRQLEPLVTPRGSIYVSSAQAYGYRWLLDHMEQQSQLGKRVITIPEDTSLYFLSKTVGPRVFAQVPGTLVPGPMTREFLKELDDPAITEIVWSNRTFGEYGATRYGVDFDTEVGEYIKQNFEPVQHIARPGSAAPDWQANLWRRKSALP
jgi:hypothetical protein